jgi:hypothetical protein
MVARPPAPKIWLDAQSALIHVGPYEFAGDAARRYPQGREPQAPNEIERAA